MCCALCTYCSPALLLAGKTLNLDSALAPAPAQLSPPPINQPPLFQPLIPTIISQYLSSTFEPASYDLFSSHSPLNPPKHPPTISHFRVRRVCSTSEPLQAQLKPQGFARFIVASPNNRFLTTTERGRPHQDLTAIPSAELEIKI